MSILDSNDSELRQLIFEKDKVIVKFIDEGCPICKALAPSFSRLATQPQYCDITFIRMHANENPVSSQEVKISGTPFFATYRNGTILDCGLLSSEAEIEQMLQKLN